MQRWNIIVAATIIRTIIRRIILTAAIILAIPPFRIQQLGPTTYRVFTTLKHTRLHRHVACMTS